MRTRLEREIRERAIDVHRDHEDLELWERADEVGDDFEPVTMRHREVEKNQIRLGRCDCRFDLPSIAHHADHHVLWAQERA